MCCRLHRRTPPLPDSTSSYPPPHPLPPSDAPQPPESALWFNALVPQEGNRSGCITLRFSVLQILSHTSRKGCVCCWISASVWMFALRAATFLFNLIKSSITDSSDNLKRKNPHKSYFFIINSIEREKVVK